jgi:16S rRNA (adenine1518-N6/adenine1519-N6)-dimethyltransferase
VVLEIGSGLGAMTIAAARGAAKVIAVEKDRRLVPLLRTELIAAGISSVQVLEKDILTLDIGALAAAEQRCLVVMGNLPYNISSQVVVRLIEARRWVDRAVLMFQKELALRLCAGPGSRTYGRLSVMLQYCADLDFLQELRADQFHPRPKVDSAVLGIRFKKRIPFPAGDEKLLASVVRVAFGKRRKTMRNALAGALPGLDATAAARLLEQSAIDPRRRAETLSVDEFVGLANRIHAWRMAGGL